MPVEASKPRERHGEAGGKEKRVISNPRAIVSHSGREGDAKVDPAAVRVDIMPTKGGRPQKEISPEQREIMVKGLAEGKSWQVVGREANLDKWTVEGILKASGDDIQRLQKDLADGKIKLSRLADGELARRLADSPERLSASELAIVSGVMTQRALELQKVAQPEKPQDWSTFAGWSGVQEPEKA